jgi:hypothetical protein
MSSKPLYPVFKGKVGNKRMHLYSVRVRFNSSRLCTTLAETVLSVLAHSPKAALEHIADEIEWRAETELLTWGPKGGEYELFISWERSISERIIRRILIADPNQSEINL